MKMSNEIQDMINVDVEKIYPTVCQKKEEN